MFSDKFLKALTTVVFGDPLTDRHVVRTPITIPPFGQSKNSVAADRRRAKKQRNIKRAKRLGHYTR